MTDPLALLSWLQLHDSAFPAGRFVHSNGWESWLRGHPDTDPAMIASLATNYLAESVATLDAVVTAHAWELTNQDQLVALDRYLTTFKINKSARLASTSCGRQLTLAAGQAGLPAASFLAAVMADRTDGNLAVVDGVLQRSLGISRFDAVLGTLRSAHAGVLGAAVRLGRLGSLKSQQLQFEARSDLVRLTHQAIATPLDRLRSVMPELELFAIQHETADGRVFAS